MSFERGLIRFFGSNRKINIIKSGLDLTQKYEEIALTMTDFCATLPTSNELICQFNDKLGDFGIKSNQALLQHEFTQIAVGFRTACGLRPDKIAQCWDLKNYPTGVPQHIAAP